MIPEDGIFRESEIKADWNYFDHSLPIVRPSIKPCVRPLSLNLEFCTSSLKLLDGFQWNLT